MKNAVIAKFPRAYAYHWRDSWTIYAARPGDGALWNQGRTLGAGKTAALAWANASDKITVAAIEGGK